jgi:L-asparaginase II
MRTGTGTCVVEVWRGDSVESTHEVSMAVVDGGGTLRAHAGDPDRRAFARSAIKPMQALPLVEDGAVAHFGITEEELALCCASHSGEPRHVELARTLLRRIGAGEEELACGAHWPFDEDATRALRAAGARPTRLHNNCSGKHAGMLTLSRFHGWPLAGYQELGHPVQDRMLQELLRWTELRPADVSVGVDGCGVATFALPLFALAAGFARLAAAARRGTGGAAQVLGAMTRHPHLVGGTGRLCTQLMQSAGGRMIVKVGAEGVYCAAVPGAELGIALKVHDGAKRAAEPALIAVLQALGLLSDDAVVELSRWGEPLLRNTRDEAVGWIRARVRLATAHD